MCCVRFLQSVLFEPDFTPKTVFPGMHSTAIPIFCSSVGSLKVGNMSVTRYREPVTPAWAVTDYKVEGATYDAITVDLHRQNESSKDGSSHRTYCSNYVQLTRTRSGRGLSLLQPATFADISPISQINFRTNALHN